MKKTILIASAILSSMPLFAQMRTAPVVTVETLGKHKKSLRLGVEIEGFYNSLLAHASDPRPSASNQATVPSEMFTRSNPPVGADFGPHLVFVTHRTFNDLSYRFADKFVRLENGVIVYTAPNDMQTFVSLTLARSMEAFNLNYVSASVGEQFELEHLTLAAYAEGGLRNRVTDQMFVEAGIKLQIFAEKRW